jgi:hypothetical protein
MRGEDVLRIEHKLDALLWYMQELTGIPPKQMPKQIPGAGGLTDGVCPITLTPIQYQVDVNSGSVSRRDGLTSGVISSGPVKLPEIKAYTSAILKGMGESNEN